MHEAMQGLLAASRPAAAAVPGGGGAQARACFLRGVSLHGAGRFEAAALAYAEASRIVPGHAVAAYGGAFANAALGRSRKAASTLAWARRRPLPDLSEVILLGKSLIEAERASDAVVLVMHAVEQHPAHADLLALQGRAFAALRQHKAAVGALLLASEADPADDDIRVDLAGALFREGQPELAAEHLVGVLRRNSDLVHQTARNAAVSLSAVLLHLARYDEALACIDAVLAVEPGHVLGLANRSLALEGVGRIEEALACGRQAVTGSARHPTICHNMAVTLLREGMLTPEAWDLYEARLFLDGPPAWLSVARLWRGEDISGQTILLHAEQGLGDTLMFIRYAALIRAGRVIVAVQKPLVRLLQGTPGVDQVVEAGLDLPPFDLVCPLASLPRLFSTTIATVPPPLPYAGLPAPARARGAPLRVGLVWAGSEAYGPNRLRSVSGDALARSLAGVPGVELCSLQLGGAGAAPLPAGLQDLMNGVADFHDTASRIAGLDLVVSVDTSVAHLAATMGKPTWVLARHCGCWRWLAHGETSPWYPTVRVVRQDSPNDWAPAFAAVREGIQRLAEALR